MSLPRPVLLRFARAGVVMWGAVHVALFLMGMRGFSVVTHVLVVALVPILAYVDVRASEESVLDGDLAIGPRSLVGVALVVATALEVAAALALGPLAGTTALEPPF